LRVNALLNFEFSKIKEVFVEAWIFGPREMKRKGTVRAQRDTLERFLGVDKEGEEPMILFAMQSGKFK
jgi:hypothetical protein